MIQKDHSTSIEHNQDFDVICDNCLDDTRYEDITFWQELITSMKDDGWITQNQKGTWKHYCPQCADFMSIKNLY